MMHEATRVGGGFPRLIVQRPVHNHRCEIRIIDAIASIAEDTGPGLAFSRRGIVDDKGRLSAAGREAVIQGVVAEIAGMRERACIVWGPHDCTWLLEDGGTVDGRDPPVGEPVEPGGWAHLPVAPVPGRWIGLPEGCSSTFLFLRRLSRDHVEVSSSEAMIIAHWDRPLTPAAAKRLGGRLDPGGVLVPPARWRGIEVTGVTEDALLGPPQPDGCRTRIVPPWPDLVASACSAIAERTLPSAMLAAAWNAVDRDPHVRCGPARGTA